MKQLYSVGPLPDSASPPGDGRPTARPASTFKAASPGLRPEEVQSALSQTAYTPPPRGGENPGPLPVRLALLQTGTAGRVLAHVAPNGGTYFAHTLLNVPATADAQLAIQTWGSPLWQRHEPDTAGELPDLPYLPVADVLDDETLCEWLQVIEHGEMLEFVLTALLVTPAGSSIVTAATAEDVARVVYAVTRALPHDLLDGFTFSTYETDPLGCPARLVGCDTGSPDTDLPGACYSAGRVGYNAATGRASELPAASPFAAFAVQALASGDTAALDEFRTTWQRLGLTDARQFDLVYRLSLGAAGLTKDEAVVAVQHPTLAAWVSARADAVKQLLDWALEDTQFAHHTLSRVIAPLRQRADAVAKVADVVRQAGFAALQAGDRSRTANALEVILPMAAPGKANAAWGEVLARVPDPDALTWEMRVYLLPRLVRFKHPSAPAAAVDAALSKWIAVPADRLADLLALELPKPYCLAAARAALGRDGEPSATLARAVAAQPALVLQLLQPHEGTTEDRAAKLFELLLTESPGHPWFEDGLANATTFPAARRNRFFEAALAAGKVDADRVIRTKGNTLFDLFSGQSGLDRLGRLFLATPPADVFTCPAVLDFLTKLGDESQVGADVKEQIAGVQAVRGFLDRPDLSGEPLRATATALTLKPAVLPEAARSEVLAAVTAELARRADSDEFQRDLEAVLLYLGHALAAGPAGLYRVQLRKQRERRDFARHPNSVHAFLAVALGAARSEELAEQTEGLEGDAFAIATEAAERGGGRLLTELDSRTGDWPKAARTQWGFLLEAVRPKGLRRALRDMLLFAAGASAASAAWFLVAQIVR